MRLDRVMVRDRYRASRQISGRPRSLSLTLILSRCKLCDFGLVRTREVTAGTPNYMAPELFLAKVADHLP